MSIVAVQPDDPDDPELFEYVLLENQSPVPQTLAGWRLVHQASGEYYALPVITLRADEQLVVWSGEGEDDQMTGARFWPAPAGRWTAGDTAALHTPDGQIVSTLLVTAPPAGEE